MEADESLSYGGAYLYACPDASTEPTEATVFYYVDDMALAERLCRMFVRVYGGKGVRFRFTAAAEITPEDQVLSDEALDFLYTCNDPDPGVYDPPLPSGMLLRAQFMFRAQAWEQILRERHVPTRRGRHGCGDGSSSPDDEIREALCSLQRTVEKHRLCFLFFAHPERKNPAARGTLWETLYRDELPQSRIPVDDIDGDGEFLFRHRWALDRFAEAAVSRFGPGQGAKPRVLNSDGQFVDVEGGWLPVWTLDECACMHLEESADVILEACKALARLDLKRRFRRLIQRAREITHDGEQPRWYSSVVVRWEYLAKLDHVITQVKAAELDICDEEPDDGESAGVTASTMVRLPDQAGPPSSIIGQVDTDGSLPPVDTVHGVKRYEGLEAADDVGQSTGNESDRGKRPCNRETASAIGPEMCGLTDTETDIVNTLGCEKLTGERVAKQAGYPFNSNFKATLSSLRKRGVLGNASPGYFVTDAYRGLSDKGQDKGQD